MSLHRTVTNATTASSVTKWWNFASLIIVPDHRHYSSGLILCTRRSYIFNVESIEMHKQCCLRIQIPGIQARVLNWKLQRLYIFKKISHVILICSPAQEALMKTVLPGRTLKMFCLRSNLENIAVRFRNTNAIVSSFTSKRCMVGGDSNTPSNFSMHISFFYIELWQRPVSNDTWFTLHFNHQKEVDKHVRQYARLEW